MSLFVAICDDEKEICAQLETILIRIFEKLKIKYEIDVYFTGEELCEKMRGGAYYDLIFLDIELAKQSADGVEVGRFIRDTHNNNMVAIVYISWHMKYAIQLFDIRPLNFLVKPLKEIKVESTIMTYLKLTKFWSGTFTYKRGHDVFKTEVRDIVYLESIDRKLILHLANGKREEFYGALKEVYGEQLEKLDFLFIHAKYVVNYDYIKEMKYDELALATHDVILPISQPRRKEIRTAYMGIMEARRK